MKRIVFSLILCIMYASTSHAALSYVVKKGDTLSEISRKFHVPIVKIKEANLLKSHRLAVGKRLTIPRDSAVSAPSQPEPTSPTARETAADDQHSDVTHTVKKGESLKKIAKKYSVSESELRDLNRLSTDKLRTGQKIVVSSDEPKTYTVRKGDSLAKIARKVKVDIAQIREINGLTDNRVKLGQKLLLAQKKAEQDEEASHDTVTYDRKTTPVIASALTGEVKESAESPDLSRLDIKDRLILFAKKLIHLPYRFGGNSIFGIDCSAYVQKVFGAAGINLPRSAREQFQVGEEVEKEELSEGDLVFFRTYASFPSHVGIYLGNNLFIHASSKSKKVTIDSLETPYYFKRFIGARRLLPEDTEVAVFPN